ncbi:MAG: hypothetical protein JHC39_04410 [Lentimicrobium sp.]|jgi:hypothetical protein|nr:hypothetical protein [Lentimicrobium sp.]
MKLKLINEMAEKERIKLTGMQTVGHFYIVLFLLLVCCLTAYSLFEIYVTKTYTGVQTSNELIRTSLPFFIAAIIFYFIQRARLNFYELTIKHSEEEFEEALRRTAAELEWKIEVHQKRYIRAIRNSNWTGSWGEMITIIIDGDRILLNSICDPDNIASVASYGWNKKNLKTFAANLKDTVNHIPIKQPNTPLIPENEWTLKNTVFRIITYLLCIFLIGLGFYAIFCPVDYKSPGIGIGVIIFPSMYLYTDLKIITTRKKSTNA